MPAPAANTPAPAAPRWSPLGVVVCLAVMPLFVLPLFTFQVRETQWAVRSRFGESATAALPAGLHVKWPWPIEKINRVDKVRHLLAGRLEETETADKRSVVVKLFTVWSVADPVVFLRKFAAIEAAEKELNVLVSTQRQIVFRSHPLTHLLSAGATGAAAAEKGKDGETDQFAAVEAELVAAVGPQALADFGIKVETIGVEQLALPERTTPNVLARMSEERQFAAAQIRLAGEEEAATLRHKANEDREVLLATAQNEAKAERGAGDVAAARVFAAVTKPEDIEFLVFLRKLEALVELTRSPTTLIIDREALPFDLLRPQPPAVPRDGPRLPAPKPPAP